LALPAPSDGAVWVCDALPQRNCGRISRPSLNPEDGLKRTTIDSIVQEGLNPRKLNHIIKYVFIDM
jgi:hypothetical protein